MLHLLDPGEAYGYEIISRSFWPARTNGALEVTDGTLYPVSRVDEQIRDCALGDAGARHLLAGDLATRRRTPTNS